MKLSLNPLPGPDGGPPANRPAALDKPVLFIGRHPDCDVIPQGTAKVSRRHCCVADASGRLRVRDLGSLNGTFVNGRRVNHEAPLKVGDVLRVGDVSYELGRRDEAVDPKLSGVISVAASLRVGGETEDGSRADSQSDVVPLGL